MLKIILPTTAAYKDDFERMLGLLERTVDKEYEIGLEIKGKPEHFQEERYLDQIKENIISVAKGVYLVIHGFSGIEVYESGIGDMRSDEGRKYLEVLLRLGEDTGADYVHVHGGAGYRGAELSSQEKREGLDNIRENILSCKNDLDIKYPLGIENLPNPSMGDYPFGSEDIWRDCVDSIDDCLYIVEGTELKVTFDTCHYAANKIGKIDLVEPAEKLREHLYHVHINDVYGYWVPSKSVWREGVIPGDGNIGEESFRGFLTYIRGNHPDISICLEVYNADYKNPVESEESIKRVLDWLKD